MSRLFAIYGKNTGRRGYENRALVDPLGDLLLSAAAVLLLAIILMLPLGAHLQKHMSEAAINDAPPLHEQGTLQRSEVFTPERATVAVLASERGIRFGPAPSDHVSVDDILDDRRLSNRLSQSSKAGRRLILFIEPDGLESAFVFEAVARRFIRGEMVQIRLRRRCHDLHAATLRRLCRFEPKDVQQ